MTQTYEARIRRVLTYIHDNPSGDLSLDNLADVAAMSRFHWHRVFHTMTGETCAQTVRRMRLHRAATLLAQSNRTIAQIAKDTGYGSVQSFTRSFSDAYGRAPAAFRKSGNPGEPALILKKGVTDMFPTEIRTMPARRVVGLIHRGAYHEIGKTFEHAGSLLTSRNLWSHCGPAIAMYLSDPSLVPQADLQSLAGAEWRGEALPEEFETMQIAGGKTAVLTLKGPYALIKSAYDELYGSWLPQSDELPGDASCYDIYLNDPRSTAPDELLTEICVPLK